MNRVAVCCCWSWSFLFVSLQTWLHTRYDTSGMSDTSDIWVNERFPGPSRPRGLWRSSCIRFSSQGAEKDRRTRVEGLTVVLSRQVILIHFSCLFTGDLRLDRASVSPGSRCCHGALRLGPGSHSSHSLFVAPEVTFQVWRFVAVADSGDLADWSCWSYWSCWLEKIWTKILSMFNWLMNLRRILKLKQCNQNIFKMLNYATVDWPVPFERKISTLRLGIIGLGTAHGPKRVRPRCNMLTQQLQGPDL